MLEIVHLSVRYGGVVALEDVDLEVGEGEIVALLGANGAGKTTLLEAVMGGERMTMRGEISLSGKAITGMATERVVAAGVALVPEGRHLFAELTVDENLRMGAYLRRDRDGIERDLAGIRSLFPILVERRGQIAATLSGGEQQMVAIGRGLMSNPRLLLLDEPSLGLAPMLVTEIMNLVRRINERGVTILLVEQNARQALRISNRAYVLEKGRIALSGPADTLAENPHVVSAYLG